MDMKLIEKQLNNKGEMGLILVSEAMAVFKNNLKSLLRENDKLKCCGNCHNFNNSSDGYICDIGSKENCLFNDICDNWVKSEVKNEK